MSTTTFRALSDVYGKVTSVAAVTVCDTGSDASLVSSYAKNELAGIAQAFAHAHLHVLGFYDLPQQAGGRGQGRSYTPAWKHAVATATPLNISVYPIPVQKMLRLGGTPHDTCSVQPPRSFQPTKWIQDGFSVLQENNGAIALLDSIYYKFCNAENPAPYFMAELLSTLDGIVLKPFPYPFLGSNILSDGRTYAFVNKTTLPSALQPDEQKAIEEALCTALGMQHVLWLGGTITESGTEKNNLFSLVHAQQGHHSHNNLLRSNHLDMYVTLGGTYTEENTTKELVFVAQIMDESIIEDRTTSTANAIETVKATNDFLQSIANQIHACSTQTRLFKVVRIPIIVDFRNHEKNLRSYNNCHVEVYNAVKNVYVPRYDERDVQNQNIFQKAETMAQEIFTTYGFTPIMVENDFITHSNAGGALHCITKVLSREQYTP